MSVQVSTMMGEPHRMKVYVMPPESSGDELWTLIISDTPRDKMFPQAEYRFWLLRDQLGQLKEVIEEALEL